MRKRLCILCYTHVRIYTCEYTRRLPNVYIKAYTLLYLCISGYTHCYIPTIYRKPEAVPERKSGGRSGWHIHILLYTSDCVHKLYTLSCRLDIMSEYVGIHVSFVYIKLYAFYFYCVYNTIRVSERMRGRTGEFSENSRLSACILCILSYTRFIMIVYIMLYIYGLYGA